MDISNGLLSVTTSNSTTTLIPKTSDIFFPSVYQKEYKTKHILAKVCLGKILSCYLLHLEQTIKGKYITPF